MTGYPRFFVYGSRYNAPAPYVRVDGDKDSTIVDPGGMDVHTTGRVDQWMDRVKAGVMSEVTRDVLIAQLEAWNQVHPQQLRLPV
jgi:hypothetical protein